MAGKKKRADRNGRAAESRAILERLQNEDINQMPVVSGSGDDAPHIVGIVTRDSILRVMQTRSELSPLATSR